MAISSAAARWERHRSLRWRRRFPLKVVAREGEEMRASRHEYACGRLVSTIVIQVTVWLVESDSSAIRAYHLDAIRQVYSCCPNLIPNGPEAVALDPIYGPNFDL